MPQAPLILAIEPDRRQSSKLAGLARNTLHAELEVVEGAQQALALIDERVPDLILTSLLLSPKDEGLLSDRLRDLDAAGAHVQTLVIPVLASADGNSETKGGLLSRFRRGRTNAAAPEGCDPAVFGAQISEYLERAAHERALKTTSPLIDHVKVRDVESTALPPAPFASARDADERTRHVLLDHPYDPSLETLHDSPRMAAQPVGARDASEMPVTVSSSWADPFGGPTTSTASTAIRESSAPYVPLHLDDADLVPASPERSTLAPTDLGGPLAPTEPIDDGTTPAVGVEYVEVEAEVDTAPATWTPSSELAARVVDAQTAADDFRENDQSDSEPYQAEEVPDRTAPPTSGTWAETLVVEPTSFSAPAFAVRMSDDRTASAGDAALSARDTVPDTTPQPAPIEVRAERDGLEVPSALVLGDEGWEEVAFELPDLETTEALAAPEPSALEPPPVPPPAPAPQVPEPAGSIDLSSFVSALEAAELAARENKSRLAPVAASTFDVPDEASFPLAGAETADVEPPRQPVCLEPFILPVMPRREVARSSADVERITAPTPTERSAVDEFLEAVAEVTHRPFVAELELEANHALAAEPMPAVQPETVDTPRGAALDIASVIDEAGAGREIALTPAPCNEDDARGAADTDTPATWPVFEAPLNANHAGEEPAEDAGAPESLEGIRDHLELLDVLNAARHDVAAADLADPADPIVEFISALQADDATDAPMVAAPGQQAVETHVPAAEPPAPAVAWTPISVGAKQAWPTLEGAHAEGAPLPMADFADEWLAEPAPMPQPAPAARPAVPAHASSSAPIEAPPRTPDVEAERSVRRSKKGRKSRKAREDRPSTVAVQDEWGFFDPAQCGFAALLAKLDELESTHNQAARPR